MMYRFLFFVLISIAFSSCYFTKALKYKKYKLEDLGDFPAVKYNKTANPFQFYKGTLDIKTKMELDSMLTGSNRYAVLIIRNDSVLYEFYNQNITDTSILPSFSVAKSFVSTMLEIAREEGKIKSFYEPITNYLPELKKRDDRFEKITIQHVLDMRSGVKSSENYYNPFSDVLRLGFGKNIAKKTLKLNIESEPNQKFEYRSVNTQLLGLIIERATGKKLQDYFYEKIYTPLQMQHDATWMYDDEKHKELRAFCCLNMTALDYAKFGRLYLHKGNWNGKQIINREWVETISNADTLKVYQGYKNQWWAVENYNKFTDSISLNQFLKNSQNRVTQVIKDNEQQPNMWFAVTVNENIYARGLLNQYIFIIPKKNMIVIHFGNSQNPNNPLKKGLETKIKDMFK